MPFFSQRSLCSKRLNWSICTSLSFGTFQRTVRSVFLMRLYLQGFTVMLLIDIKKVKTLPWEQRAMKEVNSWPVSNTERISS